MGNPKRPPQPPHDRQSAKNLGQGGHRDAEFAASIAVADLCKHLHDRLNSPGHGAQMLVDNAPPPPTDDNVVIASPAGQISRRTG
jgi:hypothetical protein